MRAVKKEVLNLIKTFLQTCQESDKELIYKSFLPPLMDPVLDDYKRNVPDARDAEVLSLFGMIITSLGASMVDHITRIFESVFQCTWEMITPTLEDFPDHRVSFFSLIRDIIANAFPALLRLSPPQFQLVMESIFWAIKHLDRNISEQGLTMMLDLITKMETSEVANDFFRGFFVSMTTEVLSVLADSFHKAGFRMQTTILAKLFGIIDSGTITVPLWKPEQGNFPNNQTFVRQYTINLVGKNFPNLSGQQVEAFVMGLFQHHNELAVFKAHLRDLLVQLKEFSAKGSANTDLFLEEQEKLQADREAQETARLLAVPGLMYVGPSAPAAHVKLDESIQDDL